MDFENEIFNHRFSGKLDSHDLRIALKINIRSWLEPQDKTEAMFIKEEYYGGVEYNVPSYISSAPRRYFDNVIEIG